MRVILNIGLAREGIVNIGVGTVLRELGQRGFNPQNWAISYSDTEFTMVAEGDGSYFWTKDVYFLAQVLHQDCIALYAADLPAGWNIGPKADKWGPFNPEKFILLDGTRLAQPVKEI
jgi:hypothetical protein